MREHEADDLTTRSVVMAARAAAKPKREIVTMDAALSEAYGALMARAFASGARAFSIRHPISERRVTIIGEIAASDAALARAIDAVPGRG